MTLPVGGNPPSEAVRVAIDAHLRKLGPVQLEDETWLRSATDQLILVGCEKIKPVKAFQRASGREPAAQYAAKLRAFGPAADMVENAIDALLGPTVLALASKGIMREELRQIVRRLRQAASVTVTVANIEAAPQATSTTARVALVRILANVYQKLTGTPPTLPHRGSIAYGPFLKLVADTFCELGIKGNPESIVVAVLREFRENHSLKKR